jgi:hypothetical protein
MGTVKTTPNAREKRSPKAGGLSLERLYIRKQKFGPQKSGLQRQVVSHRRSLIAGFTVTG